MKKFLKIIFLTLICLSLVSCASKVTYTKEFPYFPAYKSNMKANSAPISNPAGFALVRYTLKNTTAAKVFQNYEDNLKKSGWTITEEQKPIRFVAKKDVHQATVILQQNNKDVDLTISSK